MASIRVTHEGEPRDRAGLRVGINALFEPRGGSWENLRHLLIEWQRSGLLERHDVFIFASAFTIARLAALGLKHIRVVPAPGYIGGLVGRVLDEQAWLPRIAKRERIDVLFCPANTVPLFGRVPSVVVLQNAAPFCSTVTRDILGWGGWLRVKTIGWSARLSARVATRVIFISEHFRGLFEATFALPPSKGVVVYRARLHEDEGATGVALPAVVRRPYILCVSHLYPYKNLVELVEGYAWMNRELPGWQGQLVIVGANHGSTYFANVEEAIRSLGLGHEQVVLTGLLSHDVVAALLRSCEVFAFSSTCENCPTALVEALSAGAAIVCSNVGVMPEIAGDAAVYVDPFDVAAIGRALTEVVSNDMLRAQLREAAVERATAFPDHATVGAAIFAEIAGSAL